MSESDQSEYRTLDTFTDSSTDSNSNNTRSIDTDQQTPEKPVEDKLVERLEDTGITQNKIDTITEQHKTVLSVVEATAEELQSLSGIGQKTAEKVMSNIGSILSGNYTVTETANQEYTIAKWPLRDETRVQILRAEYILSRLRKKEHIGHHREMANRLVDWASSHRNDDFESIDETLCNQAYELSPSELNMGVLLDEEETYESVSDLSEAVSSAHKKSKAIIRFCHDRGKEKLVEQAKQSVSEDIDAKEKKRIEERRAQERAEVFLANPPEQVGNWIQVDTPVDGVIAYNGQFQDRFCVVALYNAGEYISIRAFEHSDWNTISWDVEDIGSELDKTQSHGTANFPETMIEGAQDMETFLNKDRFDFDPIDIPSPDE